MVRPATNVRQPTAIIIRRTKLGRARDVSGAPRHSLRLAAGVLLRGAGIVIVSGEKDYVRPLFNVPGNVLGAGFQPPLGHRHVVQHDLPLSKALTGQPGLLAVD